MVSYKSHTEEECIEAFQKGEKVWDLDTGNDGEDDVLIGEGEQIIADILNYHELTELPPHWELYQWICDGEE